MDSTLFDHLLDRYLDGELSTDEKNELQAVLLADHQARRKFWRDAHLHASLHLLSEQQSGVGEARRVIEGPGSALHEAIQDVPQEKPRERITEDTVTRYWCPSKITALPKPLRITAIAAGFAILATAGLLVMRPWYTPPAPATARISPEKSTDAEKAVEIAEVANEPLLSERLFASRSPHSSNARVKAAWERAGRIRGLLAKKRTVR